MKKNRILILSGVVVLLAVFILTMTTFLHNKTKEDAPVLMCYEPERLDYFAKVLPEQDAALFRESVSQTISAGQAVDDDRLLALFMDYVTLQEGLGFTKQTASIILAENETITMCDETGALLVMQCNSEALLFSGRYLPLPKKALQSGDCISFLEKDGRMILITEYLDCVYTLQTAWIKANDESLHFLYLGREFVLPKEDASYTGYEDIADITLTNGVVKHVLPYTEKTHGKLLSLSETSDGAYRIELADRILTGIEKMQVYDVCTGRNEVTVSDLTVGYDFTDFVLDKEGQCVAALIARKEKMDMIRVVMKTTDFASAYHERITLLPETDCNLTVGDKQQELEAGKEIEVTPESDLFSSDRIFITPKAYTGKIRITSLNRSQGIPVCRGTLELQKTSDGIIVVNELPLEEYLYSVVPSEMPSSYPIEALKAQAVSARTYAYAHMKHSSMQKYGAHVDDSAAFQVYNNINEAETTTRAVRETEGLILTYQGEIATTYFYSTSCGYGTNMTAWTCEDTVSRKDCYLMARRIAPEEEPDAGQMADEETFASYIQTATQDCYEAEDTYFRWKYRTALDVTLFWENLEKRYEADPAKILTETENGYESLPVRADGKIRDIEITKRAEGGAATELLVTGEKHRYKILTEKNIRYMLANADSDILLGAGYQKSGSVNGMLPSAFAVVQKEYDEKEEWVIGYSVTGGGFGHGIGMSQNGAKAMANQGFTCQDILTFFYPDASLVKINEEI